MAVMLSVSAYALLVAVMLYLAVKDIRERRVPNRALIVLVAVWAIWRVALAALGQATIVSSLSGVALAAVVFAGLLVLGAVYERLSGKAAMGGGDVKLMSVLALYLGAQSLAACVIVACFVSLAFAAASAGRRGLQARGIPFATCLCCGVFATFLL